MDKSIAIPEIGRFGPGPSPHAAIDAIAEAVQLLSNARQALILAGRVSRSEVVWHNRVRLAERLKAQVLTDLRSGAAFPTDHPLHPVPPGLRPSTDAYALIRQADVILSLDWIDLKGALEGAYGNAEPSAKIIQCSIDAYSHNGWSMDHQGLPPVDLRLRATPDTVVEQLLDSLGEQSASINDQGFVTTLDSTRTVCFHVSGPIGLQSLAECVNDALAPHPTTLLRLPLGWPGATCRFRHPLDYLGYDGGAGIGSGPGIAIGAALALRDSGRLPVAVIGDSDFMMSASAWWTAAHYRIPLLVVVANNRSFFNDEVHQETVAKIRKRPTENRWIGQRLEDPTIDLAAVACTQGFTGEGPIEDLAELPAALEKGIQAVTDGAAYVIDVIVEPGYAG